MTKAREEAIAWFQERRWVQHQTLFCHRHDRAPALFHPELVELFWHGPQYIGVFAFRGGAKSTLAEEFVVIAAAELRFKNIVFIGSSEGRAAERIAAVKRELERNPDIIEMYGEQKGEIWTQTRLVTKNGICIQCLGRDQDIRGLKHLDARPDLLIIDDFEDRDNVATPEGRRKTLSWFYSDLLPACSPECTIRLLATPMDAESVPVRLSKTQDWEWRTFPIVRQSESGAEESTWPDLFPLEVVERMRSGYQASGQAAAWDREFMCQAVSLGEQVFRQEYFRVQSLTRVWEPVYVAIDPARGAKNPDTASETGVVVFSWVGNKLIIWQDLSGFISPGALIDLIIEIEETYHPVDIGFERTGLNEWAAEPMRHAFAGRNIFVPLKELEAPRNKEQFILSLEPHARAGEIVLAQEMPKLVGQFLSFPRGRKDRINALAYATILRPGQPIYENFDPVIHVAAGIIWPRGETLTLALNADRRFDAGNG